MDWYSDVGPPIIKHEKVLKILVENHVKNNTGFKHKLQTPIKPSGFKHSSLIVFNREFFYYRIINSTSCKFY